MPRRWGARVVAAVVTAGSLLAACSDGGKEQAEVAAPPAAPAVFKVVDVPPAQVHRLAVEGEGRAVSLVRSSSATWLAEPPTPETSVSLLAETEDAILPLQAFRRLDADERRADFGLDAPQLFLRITDPAGVENVVAIGALTFSGAGSYARREGDSGHVYLLARGTVDALRSVLRGERVTTPRSELETKILSESTNDRDPEDVTNPWLAQVLQESRP